MSLFIVATPIGNLSDMTERAIKTLKTSSLIVAEDTRTTRKLLDRYGITTAIQSFIQHSSTEKVQPILAELSCVRDVALVTDAGTPGVSDPGGELIAAAVRSNEAARANENQEIAIVPIPGPSALAALLSVADFESEPSVFVGFLPKKKGRTTLLAALKAASSKHGIHSIVLYESPYRIQKTLVELGRIFGDEARVVVGRELTKQFEEVWYGTVTEAAKYFSAPKGEFTLIVKTN